MIIDKKLKFNKLDLAVAALFSLTTILGINAKAGDTLFNYWRHISTGILTVFIFLVLTLVHYLLIEVIKYGADWLFQHRFQIPHFLEKHLYFKVSCLIFLAWLPIAVYRYPAGVEWDAYHQIDQFLKGHIGSQHWPVASSVIMGSCVLTGQKLFGSSNMGLFLFVIVQMIFMSYVFTRVLWLLYNIRAQADYFTAAMFLFFAFCPIISVSCTSVVKDVLYGGSVLLFAAILAEYFLTGRQCMIKLFYRLSYVIRTNDQKSREALMSYLSNRGINTIIHYPIPPHLSEAYAYLGSMPVDGTAGSGLYAAALLYRFSLDEWMNLSYSFPACFQFFTSSGGGPALMKVISVF